MIKNEYTFHITDYLIIFIKNNFPLPTTSSYKCRTKKTRMAGDLYNSQTTNPKTTKEICKWDIIIGKLLPKVLVIVVSIKYLN